MSTSEPQNEGPRITIEQRVRLLDLRERLKRRGAEIVEVREEAGFVGITVRGGGLRRDAEDAQLLMRRDGATHTGLVAVASGAPLRWEEIERPTALGEFTEETGGLLPDRRLGALPDRARTAIETQLACYYAPDTPCQGLHGYRILSIEEGAIWGAHADEICVHFHYVREDARQGDPPGLELVVYGRDGSVHRTQDYG